MQKFYSSGKLLLSGEYLVLDGARSLALPTLLGQEMIVNQIEATHTLHWISKNHLGEIWFQSEFSLPDLEITSFHGEEKVAETLVKILSDAKVMNPDFLSNIQGIEVINSLEFPRDWGLGSSSTLINNIASWACVDPFELLFSSFGGSGYDIACASAETPILYTLTSNKPEIESVNFDPPFKNNLFFVHLNKKQISSDSIKYYRDKKVVPEDIEALSEISISLLNTRKQEAFDRLLQRHEDLIAEILETNPIQKSLFNDFEGQIKSLGGWGGDFILASGNENTPDYFKSKGFHTVIPYDKMIKSGWIKK